jgi:hypothetical protein
MSSEPFISNDLFILYSDVVLDKEYTLEEVNRKMNASERLIIFIKTELLNSYIPWLLSLTRRYTLITTCNDDHCMPYFSFPPMNLDIKNLHDSLLGHSYLNMWFTKNPSILHPKLTYLPLGPKWQYTSVAFFGEDKKPILDILHRQCTTPSDLFYSNKSKLVYVNFDTTTTSPAWRPFYIPHTNIRDMIRYWCTQKGFEVSGSCGYEDYLKELKEYKFCVSPPGRGIDTHRAFESLMVGTIPILITSPLDSMYDDLPVLIISNLSVITQEYLEEQYLILKKKVFRFEKLYAPYWKQRIEGSTRI